jgi:PEP-CTERM motif
VNRQKCFAAALLLVFVIGTSREASAEIILGTRIDLSATTFALPINIVDGIDVENWFFDLTYDASNVQVNTGCDPFGGDPYCSLLTGAVTEGDFFASGAPFNLLNPGFIDLDPVTLMQTGLLFGVNGAFGGFLPLPSGNGTLAFVEFMILGDGNSDVTVDGSVVTTVPEPGTLALFTTGVLLAGAKRLSRRSDGGRACDTDRSTS